MVRDDRVATEPRKPSVKRPLAEVARQAAVGEASAEELHEAFLTATLYCEAGEQPGFAAVGSPSEGLIPAYRPAHHHLSL